MGKLSKEELGPILDLAEMQMQGRYHAIYEWIGLERNSNGSYHCYNKAGHSGGVDANPSLSICNDTGMHNCFACGVKGNLFTFWKENITQGKGYFHEFLATVPGVTLGGIEGKSDSISSKDKSQMIELYEKFSGEFKERTGQEYRASSTKNKVVKETTQIEPEVLDDLVDKLLKSDAHCSFLLEERNINRDMIKKYRIGLDGNTYVFPGITFDNYIVNFKKYTPKAGSKSGWYYYPKGSTGLPFPIDNFSSNTLYFFEGEPDALCATGFGIPGAVTMGAAGNNDVVKVLGEDNCVNILKDKEIVICFDGDDAGRKNSVLLAKSILPYARQVKVIDLDMGPHMPDGVKGLDPDATKDVSGKAKRSEKDFTDFMKKNGFSNSAKNAFTMIVDRTCAYTDHRNRASAEEFKVTVSECRSAKYHSYPNQKRIITSASISEVDDNSFMYYKEFAMECACNGDKVSDLPKMCNSCSLPNMRGFDEDRVIINTYRDADGEVPTGDGNYIKYTESTILGIIECNERQKLENIKKTCGINYKCPSAKITGGAPVEIKRVGISPDASSHTITEADFDKKTRRVDINTVVPAYIINAYDMSPGSLYELSGTQVISPNGQHVTLFIDKVVSKDDDFGEFKINDDIIDMLKVFRPKHGESVEESLNRRYREFGAKDKVYNCEDLYALSELPIFSQVSFPRENNFSAVDRAWVEVAIVGETRTGKSLVGKGTMKRYNYGEFIPCSDGVTRSGILGGIVKKMKGQSGISWGAIPKNDGGFVMFDEVGNMDRSILSDMTASRSDGIYSINMSSSSKAAARTAKLMISNPDELGSIAGGGSTGLNALRSVFDRDEMLSRFDAAMYSETTIPQEELDALKILYESMYNKEEFSMIALITLLRWAKNLDPNDIVFSDDFDEALARSSRNLTTKYHKSTILINIETKVKIARMSISTAALNFSIVSDDEPHKLLVTAKHVERIEKLLDRLYSSSSMKLDIFSMQRRSEEELGGMDEMENLIAYTDIPSLIRERLISKDAIQQIFIEALERVEAGHLNLPTIGRGGKAPLSHTKVYNGVNKIIGFMLAKNCLQRAPKGASYVKTPMFEKWLYKMKEKNTSEFSTILERTRKDSGDTSQGGPDKSADSVIEKLERGEKICGDIGE